MISTKAYPYEIKRVPMPDARGTALNPWAVQEFFRIEAWLRSNSVMDLYRREGRTTESDVKLMCRCRFNWNVLDGSHHRYLDVKSGRDTVVPGIWVLRADELMWIAGALSTVGEHQPSDLKRQFFQWARDQVYWLCVDPTLPPDIALKVIRPILIQRQTATKDTAKQPRQFDLTVWLKYLHCYDLRVHRGMTYQDIALQVYPDVEPTAHDHTKKAVMKIHALIESVERNEWPPRVL